MNSPHDLSGLLSEWTFDPTRVTARHVTTAEGEQQVQLRLDLGILQMQLHHRPDGQTPHGYPSLLEYYTQLLHTDRRGALKLDSDSCSELQQECVQFYYRYLALMVLKDHDRVIADTRHSLDIFDLVEQHAESEDLIWDFLQFKPYVIMMHSRAKADKLSAESRIDEAVEAVEQGIREIASFLVTMEGDLSESMENENQEVMELESQEITLLQELIHDLRENGPEENPVVALKQKLMYAVSSENFEEAARLRDSIQKMEETLETSAKKD